MKKLPFIFLISIFLFSCAPKKNLQAESDFDGEEISVSLSQDELSLSDAKRMISNLEKTHQKLYDYFVCLIVTVIAIAAILVFFNARESKQKDKIIYSSEQFLKHSISVQEAERKRISQELHDSVAQSLRYVSLLAENISDREIAEKIISTQNENIENIRKLCYNLTPPAITGSNIVSSVSLMGLKIFDAAHTDFQFRVVHEPSVSFEKYDDDMLMNIYRIVQEALQNIQKHACASEATVLFRSSDNGNLKIIVSDDGRGMNENLIDQINGGFFETVENMRFGLRNIFERVKFLHGKISYFSDEDSGTRIVLEI